MASGRGCAEADAGHGHGSPSPPGFCPEQDHGHRAPRRGVVDMDRQEAALVVVSIEQRQLLMTVHDIDRVADVERHARGRRPVALQPDIDQHIGKPDDGPEVWQVFGPRQRRLRAQVQSGVGQPPAGELEGRIVAQSVKVIGVFVATGDRQDAGANNVGQLVRDPARSPRIADHRGEPIGQTKTPLGRGQQHHAAIRGDPSTVERHCDLLACNGWK